MACDRHGFPKLNSRVGRAAATDHASVITLANELRAALIEKGLIKGGI